MSPTPRIVRDPAQMQSITDQARGEGQTICVVPTMGFLHEGHLSLLREGRRRSDLLILTLFVNPTQFAPNEDLADYPRDEKGDLERAGSCGTDIAFCPVPESMYPDQYQTYVEVRELSKPLCGVSRPTHFGGVATIVTKLFNITKPHIAVFGTKDFQQLALLRRLNHDLNMGIEIIGMPIVREADGLAISSRNKYLGPEERTRALCLSRGLAQAKALFERGERDPARLLEVARNTMEATGDARIDYLEMRDATTLQAIDTVKAPAVMALAVFFGSTRLIDNAVFDPSQ